MYSELPPTIWTTNFKYSLGTFIADVA
jgi:hypothetical protein